MISVRLDLRGAVRPDVVNFEVVADPVLTPLYVFFGIVNAVQQLESVYGPGTIDLEATVRFAGGRAPVQ